MWILRKALKATTTERRALDVDRGTEPAMGAFGYTFLAEELSCAVEERLVPSGSERGTTGETCGADAGKPFCPADSVRAVTYSDRGHIVFRNGIGMPEIVS